LIYNKYRFRLVLDIESNQEEKSANLFESKYMTDFIFDMVVEVVTPYPWVIGSYFSIKSSNKSFYYYNINDMFHLFNLVKVVMSLKYAMNFLPWKSVRASNVCKMQGCEASSLFTFKAIMDEAPTKTASTLLLIAILIYS
jgi:hypothetical protein